MTEATTDKLDIITLRNLSRIDQLRSRLEAMILPAAVSVIKTLNEQDRVALVMNQNTNGELYHHLLIQTWLNSEQVGEYEDVLLEALNSSSDATYSGDTALSLLMAVIVVTTLKAH